MTNVCVPDKRLLTAEEIACQLKLKLCSIRKWSACLERYLIMNLCIVNCRPIMLRLKLFLFLNLLHLDFVTSLNKSKHSLKMSGERPKA